MKKTFTVMKAVFLMLCLVLLMGRAAIQGQKRSAADAAAAANKLVAALTPEQKAKAVFKFDDQERVNWWFVPRVRNGLTLKDMTPAQHDLVQNLLKTTLSAKGVKELDQIRRLESILREIEAAAKPGGGVNRDPELYYVSIFGTPGAKDPWGWRFEGHHISTNFTMIAGQVSAWSPEFRGANPAEVMSGPEKGLRVLAAPEDKAFALLHALDDKQKQTAVLQTAVPRDIVTSNRRNAELQSPAGLLAADMTAAQKKLLRELITEYSSRMIDEVASERMRRIDQAGFDKIGFVWVGADALHEPHYYRVQGPTFLIEFDEVQGNANHIHSVWRDFTGDWGEDLLKKHYESAHK
jgi:hypothetical protein